jgi:site-specific DNA-methyltransferase (adenine-specific)
MLDDPQIGQREWLVGRQRILQVDCLTGLAALPPESIDVCVTSPPYNIGIAYRSYQDRMPRPAYLDWLSEIGGAIHRVLKPAGSFFLNVGSTGSDPWIGADAARAMGEPFILQNHIVWVKSLSIGNDTVGHFKPINSARFLNHNHEAIFHFTKTGRVPVDRLAVGVPFKDKSNIARWGHARDRRCGGNVWFIPYETVKSRAQKFDHPAGFPVELPLRCIQLHGAEAPLVLDPFLGAGTTLVAAQKLGAAGIGFEVDMDYAERAAARLASALPHQTRADPGPS